MKTIMFYIRYIVISSAFLNSLKYNRKYKNLNERCNRIKIYNKNTIPDRNTNFQ